jgi:hypothetical protein
VYNLGFNNTNSAHRKTEKEYIAVWICPAMPIIIAKPEIFFRIIMSFIIGPFEVSGMSIPIMIGFKFIRVINGCFMELPLGGPA